LSCQPDELNQLVASHAASLGLYARQWSSEPSDVVQESILELIKQSLRPIDPVAWLYTVVRSRAINSARSDARRRNHERRAATERPSWFRESHQSRINRTREQLTQDGFINASGAIRRP